MLKLGQGVNLDDIGLAAERGRNEGRNQYALHALNKQNIVSTAMANQVPEQAGQEIQSPRDRGPTPAFEQPGRRQARDVDAFDDFVPAGAVEVAPGDHSDRHTLTDQL